MAKERKYSKAIYNWPEDERPRERLLKFGADLPREITQAISQGKLSDTELLAIQATYADAKARRRTTKGWKDVWIEFEYRSSQFKIHKHDPKECDIIVCWEHDWKVCPIEVIELKSEIQKLKKE